MDKLGRLEVEQLKVTSTTPPADSGLYKIDETTMGVVGDLKFRHPKTGAMSSALTVTSTSAQGVVFGNSGPDGGLYAECVLTSSMSEVEMKAAILAAGPFAKVLFPRNTTIVLRGCLTPLTGQKWDLRGSTLKRHDTQFVSTTTTNISGGAGPTTVVVADASGFSAGDVVYAYRSTTYESYPHYIQSVDYATNTLVIAGQWLQAFATGAEVTIAQGGALVCHAIHGTDTPKVEIFNGVLDDSFVTLTASVYWANFSTLLLQSSYGHLHNLEVKNGVCEGFTVSGKNVKVDSCYIHDMGGNGIHFNGAGVNKGMRASRNWIENTNLRGIGPGHENGSVGISTPVLDSEIVDNVFINGIAAIAGYSNVSFRSIFSRNVVINMRTWLVNFSSAPTCPGIIISDNLFINTDGNSKELRISVDNTTNGASIISGNYFYNTRILFDYARGVNVIGNAFFCTTPGASAWGQAINSNYSKDLIYEGNYCYGYQRFARFGSTTTSDIAIIGNYINDVYMSGIAFDTESSDITMKNNVISLSAGFTPHATFVGIVSKNKSIVRGNTIRLKPSTAGITGISGAAGGSGVLGAIIDGNEIFVSNTSTQNCITTPAGSQNNQINANYVNRAITDSGTNAVGTNYLVPY